jgi:hypothetical protein
MHTEMFENSALKVILEPKGEEVPEDRQQEQLHDRHCSPDIIW